jgi:Multiubiquitin
MAPENNELEQVGEVEIDIFEFAERGEETPLAKVYRVRIDDETVKVHTPCPTGDELLHKVGRRSCAFELIEEFRHHENNVVEPGEKVDLRKPGLKRFITAQKEIVTIFINDKPYPIERGPRTVAEILSKVGQTPEGYTLLEEKDGPPMPLPPNVPVKIHGCEIFHSQAQSGGSS